MNNQQLKSNPARSGTQGTGAPASRPPQRRRPSPALLRLLRNTMLTLAGMIVVIGLLLLILPTFRVQSITVKGASYHTEEEIRAASGIVEGQEILGINVDAVCESIWNSCAYVDEISIKFGMNHVTIEITERANLLYTEFAGRYFSIDASDFRVLEESYDELAFADFIKVELPLISSLSIGKPLNFDDPAADLSYVGECLNALAREGCLSDVSYIDFSGKYHVSYVMDNSCRVNLGRIDHLEDKLAAVQLILDMKGDVGGFASVVDVSDPDKPTFRLVGESEQLRGA